MRPVSSPVETVQPAPAAGSTRSDDWADRAGRLYTDLERPARAMVHRAYRGAFSDDELDDIYASAWAGTLRALGRRHEELSDEEVRKYLLTAVANQAGKELRRRRRKPTAPLDRVDSVADQAGTPDERAVGAERSRVARDLLTSLPPRRRAVMLLRYGWGLEPRQVCALVDGLSPRAYRKEVTRGVDELTERMRQVERGEWCSDRESVLKAYAAGLADGEQRRQAEAHLSHCHQCTDFVGRLSGHLHDCGAGLAVPGALDAVDGGVSLVDRVAEMGDRGREAVGGLLSRGAGEAAPEAIGQAAVAGGTRGAAGTAGAALVAKLTGVGTAGKVAVACLTGGAAATVCLSAGVVPALDPGSGESRNGESPEASAPREPGGSTSAPEEVRLPPTERRPAEPPAEEEPPAPPPSEQPPAEEEPPSAPSEPVDPVAPSTPPVQQEWGVSAAASGGGGGASGSQDGGGGGGSPVKREFGGP